MKGVGIQRKLARYASFVAVFGVGMILLAGPAAMADVGIGFVEVQPLVLPVTSASDVHVLLVNSSARAVTVRLIVAGAARQSFEQADSKGVPVGPGATETITIRLTSTARPSRGQLIAVSSDGSVARRPLRLFATSAIGISPSDHDGVAWSGTSFVPSLFRPVPSARSWAVLFVCAAVLALLAGLVWRRQRPKSRPLALPSFFVMVAAVCVVLVGAAGLLTLAAAGIHGREASVPRIPLAEVSDPAVASVLADDHGHLVALRSAPGGLEAGGADRAGTFSGTIDLTPGEDGGGVKATLHVRDYWPYAIVAITAGVVVGYVMAAYFRRRRPLAQAKVALAELWRNIVADESEWQRQTAPIPWASGFSMIGLAQRIVEDAQADLANSDAAAAEDKRTKLDAYAADFRVFRSQLSSLGVKHMHLVETAVRSGSGGNAGLLGKTASVIEPLSLQDENITSGQVLKERDAARGTASVELAALETAVTDATMMITNLENNARPETIQQVETLRPKLAAHLSHVFQATTIDSLATLEREAGSLGSAVHALKPEPGRSPPPRPLAGNPVTEAARAHLERVGSSDKPGAGEVVVTRTAMPGSTADIATDVDDLVQVEAAIVEPSGAPLHWWFSDGTASVPQPPPPGATRWTMRAGHQFAPDAETFAVQIRDDQEKARSAMTPVDVHKPGRTYRTRLMLNSDDRAATLVAAAVAIGSGFVALYLGSDAWGSPSDYVKAVLWGSATAEGAKVALTLVTRNVGSST